MTIKDIVTANINDLPAHLQYFHGLITSIAKTQSITSLYNIDSESPRAFDIIVWVGGDVQEFKRLQRQSEASTVPSKIPSQHELPDEDIISENAQLRARIAELEARIIELTNTPTDTPTDTGIDTLNTTDTDTPTDTPTDTGIDTPTDTPTDTRIDTLITQLRSEGLGYGIIAKRLNTTKSRIQRACKRLGI